MSRTLLRCRMIGSQRYLNREEEGMKVYHIDDIERAWDTAKCLIGREPNVSREEFWKIYKSEMNVEEMTAYLIEHHTEDEQ